MSGPRVGARPRAGLAAAGAGIAFAASYALQRLGSWLGGEVAFSDVVAQEHVPFFWRCGLAAVHGVLVALVLGLGLSEEAAARWLGRVPWIVGLVGLPLALAMGLVP